ncbi:hypothetical protein AB0L82_35415 [Nocardia sp. NPDC052001]|uniref:hypothetical protein n=1 Tax=Nocardia sp. NPDC052001 TaxID=3154853 RepID=UPI003445E7B0
MYSRSLPFDMRALAPDRQIQIPERLLRLGSKSSLPLRFSWHGRGVPTILESVLGGTGVVTAAVIAGSIAVRTARKTPHENLKSLLEILKDDHLEAADRDIIAASVHREIARIGMLNAARLQGFWAYQRERLLGRLSPTAQMALFTALVLPPLSIATVWLWPIAPTTPYVGWLSRQAIGNLIVYRYEWRLRWRWPWWPWTDVQGGPTHAITMPWLDIVGLVVLVFMVWALTRFAQLAARSPRLVRSWAVFAGFLVISEGLTYVCYRLVAQLDPNPVAMVVRYDTYCSTGYERVDTAENSYACVYTPPPMDNLRATGDTWIQPWAPVVLFAVLAGWVVVGSLLIRYVPPMLIRTVIHVHPVRWLGAGAARIRGWLRRLRSMV